jgi:hypothetical protein
MGRARPNMVTLQIADNFGRELRPPVPESVAMPIVSVFYGIVVRMYYHDHEPPHFHVEYQDERGTFTLDGEMTRGVITSVRARRRIREWALARQAELAGNWLRARAGMQLERIPPLP